MGHRTEREFLPAAIEITETPASSASRAVALAIAGVIAVGALWAWFSRLDVVVVAGGRTVPASHVKTVQPFEIGVVRALRVRDGQAVRRGDILIELDPTATAADRERLTHELNAARLDVARLEAALAAPEEEPFRPPSDAKAALVGQQRARLVAQIQEHAARLAAIDNDLARRRAEQGAVQAQVTKLERTVPLARDRAESYGTLARQGFVARLAHVETEQLLIEQEQELAMQRHRLEEAMAQIAALVEQRRQVEAEYRRQLLGQLTDAQTRASSLAQDVVKADRRHALNRLVAPIDGVVQQLAVHTVGGVVTPAQALMTIVPSGGVIEVEAVVLNRDAGFVRAGQSAHVKVETFPFTRYGTVPGHVVHLSADAVDHARLGLVFPARVALERAFIDVDGRRVELAPGMSVTVEIAIGQRRVLEYVLEPLLRYASDSLRER